MITPQNFEADIDNLDALGIMIKLKPTDTIEGGTALLLPHTFGPPIHFHPLQSELFTVVQGELEVFKKNVWILLKAGEKIFIPKRTPHSFRNISNEVVVFDFVVTPKIGLTYLLLTYDELVKSGKVKNISDFKSILYMSQAMAAFPKVTRSVKPPHFVVKLLSTLGKLFGLSVEREKYRAEFLRPVKLWKGPKRKPADLSTQLEEMLF